MDLNTKKLKKNAFRITKVRGKLASRVRVPGGLITAEQLLQIQKIASEYGDGRLHITTRQGFEILGIDPENVEKVKELLQPVIESLNINQDESKSGYPSSGTRNVASCIGNKVCPFANYDTTAFAKRVENDIFPNDLHVKVALTGCPNDCIKARMHDFGIIGMTEPQYDAYRCVGCNACVKACQKKSVGALSMVNYKIVRNEDKCIGCGVCVNTCPMNAWSRSQEKYFKLTIMGRTGKRNPRLGEDFLIWADEESIRKIIVNTYAYAKEYIDKDAPDGKEHIGYIIDRTGFEEYKKWALKGVEFPEKTIIKQRVYWSGLHY